MASKISELTKELAAPILEELDLELVDVEYVKEGQNWFLRVFIDSPAGVDLDTCAQVSERLSDKLDEDDPVSDAYFLEVSSPGAERPLKGKADYKKAIDKNVRVTTYEPINGEKAFEGKLVQAEDNEMTLAIKKKTKMETVVIPYEKIASARLAIIF
ncbi:ribosome maturation factor RimP [Scopulibacillus darangshiensis]|uniref:Ribosome maturation factor RimP n=1 Tax=Scopulibacillus darangshiensis TaxID=442528 RepID=A0A4V2SN88_9BACL|nr:ribosome maturation factor RimP [Scopulibacillus darangshiensis]TCP30296.1 ribosome maturation factor RimP [Scopulibacillus darangshiensis]